MDLWSKRLQRNINIDKDILIDSTFFHLLCDNFDKLKDSNLLEISKDDDIFDGNDWHNESGCDIILKFKDGTEYNIGYRDIVDDGENWAQAECYTLYHSTDYITLRHEPPINICKKILKLNLRKEKIKILLNERT